MITLTPSLCYCQCSNIFQKTKTWSGKARLLAVSLIIMEILWAKGVLFRLKDKYCFKDWPMTNWRELNFHWDWNQHECLWYSLFNPFIPSAPFLYPLKTENITIFCFQEMEKGCIGNEWVKIFTFFTGVFSTVLPFLALVKYLWNK